MIMLLMTFFHFAMAQVPATGPVQPPAPPVADSKALNLGAKKPDAVLQDTAGTATVELPREVLVYDSSAGRDPFQRPAQQAVAAANPNSLEDAALPDGVQVIAIAYNPKNPRALLLKLSDRKTYTAFVGTRIGFLGGVVETITEDSVIVKQQVEVAGRMESDRVILTFKKFQNRN
jgi:hypothetical protein